MSQEIGLYIHIPFCAMKCSYCDFLSFGGKPQITRDLYIESLVNEINNINVTIKDSIISSLYIGGGTPSILSINNITKVMKAITNNYRVKPNAEITIEVNPGTVNKKLVETYLELGINRVSIGLQSANDAMLKDLGRIHTYQRFLDTYNMIVEAGIKNINVDIMFGLSNQTISLLEDTLNKVIELDPTHISAYSLIIEPGTDFEKRYDDELLHLPSEDQEREMFWYTNKKLRQAGYCQYEISNYAKPKKEAIHNSSYWTMKPYIAVGLGASSYFNQVRYKNITNLNTYIKANGCIDLIRTVEQVNTDAMDLEETFFLGLRLLEGVNLDAVWKKYNDLNREIYETIINRLIKEALLYKEGPIIKLTHKGIDLGNVVFSQFILG